MARRRLTLVCALGVLLLTPQAAVGGGWWSNIDVERSTVAAGQRVKVNEEVLFQSTAAAEEAASRFYVYLLRDFDYSVVERAMQNPSPRNWWSLAGAEAIQVGQVTVSVSDSNLARASAAFIMPELPPATYHLMLCDAGCEEPLADVIPASGFTVVADPATAQLGQRVDALEQRSRKQADQLTSALADADRARGAARAARSEAEQLRAAALSAADEGRSSPWVPYVGWFVAGTLIGAVALLVLRRRSQPAPAARVAGWQTTDEELRELLT
ncbi:MAG: hypothetical protein M3355_11530, partial [Actinomycetota bacterium]|nr:hypothetical protein [Actinomycetota bacterium]